MKKKCRYILLIMGFLLTTITGCGKKASEVAETASTELVQTAVISPNSVNLQKTIFFTFELNTAYFANEYHGYKPSAGYRLLVANITVSNESLSSVTMYDTDFQCQWGETDQEGKTLFAFPITYDKEKDADKEGAYVSEEEQLPGTYDIEGQYQRSGDLVYEVPENCDPTALSISTKDMVYDSETGEYTEYGPYFISFSIVEMEQGEIDRIIAENERGPVTEDTGNSSSTESISNEVNDDSANISSTAEK
jgi:hypothetical protein